MDAGELNVARRFDHQRGIAGCHRSPLDRNLTDRGLRRAAPIHPVFPAREFPRPRFPLTASRPLRMRRRYFLDVNVDAGISKRRNRPGNAAVSTSVHCRFRFQDFRVRRRRFSARGESPCALAMIFGATCSHSVSPVAEHACTFDFAASRMRARGSGSEATTAPGREGRRQEAMLRIVRLRILRVPSTIRPQSWAE